MNLLKWFKILSSHILHVGHNGSDLYVQFNGTNATWKYKDVPTAVYLAFLQSDSKGSFYSENIKGKYEGEVQPHDVDLGQSAAMELIQDDNGNLHPAVLAEITTPASAATPGNLRAAAAARAASDSNTGPGTESAGSADGAAGVLGTIAGVGAGTAGAIGDAETVGAFTDEQIAANNKAIEDAGAATSDNANGAADEKAA